MRFLLDTHIFLFFINGESSISEEIIEILNDKQTEKFISIVSIWEITIKMNIGKLRLKDDLKSIYILLDNFDIKIFQLNKINFEVYLSLPFIHKDPFDRMIISQAVADDLTLITDDQYIRSYPNLKLF
jgi:PIN domain nuclease of toxin-antitoxin system